jgi:hypothetical protein
MSHASLTSDGMASTRCCYGRLALIATTPTVQRSWQHEVVPNAIGIYINLHVHETKLCTHTPNTIKSFHPKLGRESIKQPTYVNGTLAPRWRVFLHQANISLASLRNFLELVVFVPDGPQTRSMKTQGVVTL